MYRDTKTYLKNEKNKRRLQSLSQDSSSFFFNQIVLRSIILFPWGFLWQLKIVNSVVEHNTLFRWIYSIEC